VRFGAVPGHPPLHAHDRRFLSLSQKGTHSPSLHLPMSTQTVSSGAFPGGGHSLLFPTDRGTQGGQSTSACRREKDSKGNPDASRGEAPQLVLGFHLQAACQLPCEAAEASEAFSSSGAVALRPAGSRPRRHRQQSSSSSDLTPCLQERF